MVYQAAVKEHDKVFEKRKNQRVDVNILGRYMLPNHEEHSCQTLNVSPGGISMLAPKAGNLGDRIIAYFDHIGRIEGEITRLIEGGFAMSVHATLRKKDKMAAQLTWLANRNALGLPEDRRHERIEPVKKSSVLELPDGSSLPCHIFDISLSGAAIKVDKRPPIGAKVILGKTKAQIVRHIDHGVAIEFSTVQPQEKIDQEYF